MQSDQSTEKDGGLNRSAATTPTEGRVKLESEVLERSQKVRTQPLIPDIPLSGSYFCTHDESAFTLFTDSTAPMGLW